MDSQIEDIISTILATWLSNRDGSDRAERTAGLASKSSNSTATERFDTIVAGTIWPIMAAPHGRRGCECKSMNAQGFGVPNR